MTVMILVEHVEEVLNFKAKDGRNFFWSNCTLCLKKTCQHIFGAVGNVIQCFLANLTDFPAVEEFSKICYNLTKLSPQ